MRSRAAPLSALTPAAAGRTELSGTTDHDADRRSYAERILPPGDPVCILRGAEDRTDAS